MTLIEARILDTLVTLKEEGKLSTTHNDLWRVVRLRYSDEIDYNSFHNAVRSLLEDGLLVERESKGLHSSAYELLPGSRDKTETKQLP